MPDFQILHRAAMALRHAVFLHGQLRAPLCVLLLLFFAVSGPTVAKSGQMPSLAHSVGSPAVNKEPDPHTLAKTIDPSAWRLSPEAEHLYYYLLLADGLTENSELVIAHALRGLLKLDPSLSVYQDSATILLARGEYAPARETAIAGLRLFSEDPLLTLLLAGTYSESGETQKAVRLLERFLKKHPHDAQVVEELIRLYHYEGQDKKASNLLARLPASDGNPESELFRACILSTAGRNTEARQILEKLLAAAPGLFEAWAELAFIAEKDNDHHEAARAYAKAIELMPGNPELRLRIALMYVKQNEPDKALEAINSADPSEHLYMQAALIFADNGFYEQAAKMLDMADKNGAVPEETVILRSIMAEESGNPLAGLAQLERVQENSPLYPVALHQTARLYMAAKEYDKANNIAHKARELFPERKELWGIEAYALLKMQQADKAEDLLKQALEEYPDDEDLLFSLGSVQHDAGKIVESMETMQRIITINPKNHMALNHVGYSLADSGKNLARALTLINAALEQAPDADYIIDSLAWVQYRMGKYNEAWASINMAIDAGGDAATIWEHYGDIALAVGKKDEAARGYASAIAKNPDNIDALEKKLSKLKKRSK